MEWKIGEIFEYNGEWYQCVESKQDACTDCAFNPINGIGYNCSGSCTYKQVIFKKLEKVGEPYDDCGTILQRFKIYTNVTNADTKGLELHIYSNNTIAIEIKQNKEDMEEKKLNLKPFDIQKAKEGKPVCTRDGRKARIICFDRVGDFPIVALTDDRDYKEEGVNLYDINGKGSNECFDLMMLPEKKEGWVNVYHNKKGEYWTEQVLFSTKKEATDFVYNHAQYVTTVKIEWEE